MIGQLSKKDFSLSSASSLGGTTKESGLCIQCLFKLKGGPKFSGLGEGEKPNKFAHVKLAGICPSVSSYKQFS